MHQITVQPDQVFAVNTRDGALEVNGQPFDCDWQPLDAHSYHALHRDRSYVAEVLKADYATNTFVVRLNGRVLHLRAQSQLDLLLEQMGMGNATASPVNEVKAPMPGLILAVKVKVGDEVKKGDALIILEAMKMENVIKSPTDGTVRAVHVAARTNVDKNQPLVGF